MQNLIALQSKEELREKGRAEPETSHLGHNGGDGVAIPAARKDAQAGPLVQEVPAGIQTQCAVCVSGNRLNFHRLNLQQGGPNGSQ